MKVNWYKAPRNVDIMEAMGRGSLSSTNNPFNKYMLVPISDKSIITEAALDSLWSDYLSNDYFITLRSAMKHISLSKRKQEKIYNILLEIEDYTANDADDINMDEFYRLLRKAGAVIGGNNDYKNPDMYFNRDRRRVSFDLATYEQALTEYNKFAVGDGVSGGLARLFAGHISIACLLLGGIVAVFYLLKDKKHGETLSGKSISSVRMFTTKYIALNVTLLLPVLLLAAAATVHAGWIAKEISAAGFDVFAFFKVSVFWILPTIMFATAFTMLITAATNTPTAVIMLAPLWWAQMPVRDSFGLHMAIINFYYEFSYNLYRIARPEIIINRIFYTMVSLILVCVTVWLYHLRRGGRWNVSAIFRNIQKKH